MKEVYVKKDGVIKKVHENIASEYKNIGWIVISEKEVNKTPKYENKSSIVSKKEDEKEEE